MNASIRNLVTVFALTLTVSVPSVAQIASAQKNCKEAKGRWVDVFSGGNTTAGTITNAGILNGTTLTVYTSTAFPTPVATTVSYTGDLTITTNHGQLKASNVYIYDFASGLWTAMGSINPASSTGRFAGATGVIYFNGKTIGSAIPITYPSEITGEICLAKE